MHREEGKFGSLESAMRKKKKAAQLQKLPLPNKSRPPPRTLQLYTQDNNSTFSQMLSERYSLLKSTCTILIKLCTDLTLWSQLLKSIFPLLGRWLIIHWWIKIKTLQYWMIVASIWTIQFYRWNWRLEERKDLRKKKNLCLRNKLLSCSYLKVGA